MMRSLAKSVLGTTLIEAVVALGVVGVVTSGMYALNGQVMNLVKSNQHSSASSLVLQERVEQLRIATWRQVTDKEYLKNTLMGSDVRSASSLGTLSERITISAYPDVNAVAPIVITRTSGGAAVLASEGGNFLNQALARVDVSLEFTGTDGRPHSRSSSTVISKSGVSRLNITTAANTSGIVPTPTPTPTPVPTPTAAPDSSPTPTPDPTPNPTPDPTPRPTTRPTARPTTSNGNGNGNGNSNSNSGGNGNGNGQGTVGGNSGKG